MIGERTNSMSKTQAAMALLLALLLASPLCTFADKNKKKKADAQRGAACTEAGDRYFEAGVAKPAIHRASALLELFRRRKDRYDGGAEEKEAELDGSSGRRAGTD